ncbi:hypothetical protein RintRC_5287 [Richelia intracellularis]|nr:hypothetical protein RintRC_5287 [Richelia intracellularis]
MRDHFTKFSTISQTISQWFQTLIHPALMERQIIYLLVACRIATR